MEWSGWIKGFREGGGNEVRWAVEYSRIRSCDVVNA